MLTLEFNSWETKAVHCKGKKETKPTKTSKLVMAEIKKRLYFVSCPGFFYQQRDKCSLPWTTGNDFSLNRTKILCLVSAGKLRTRQSSGPAPVQSHQNLLWECTIPAQTGAKFPALGSSAMGNWVRCCWFTKPHPGLGVGCRINP